MGLFDRSQSHCSVHCQSSRHEKRAESPRSVWRWPRADFSLIGFPFGELCQISGYGMDGKGLAPDPQTGSRDDKPSEALGSQISGLLNCSRHRSNMVYRSTISESVIWI